MKLYEISNAYLSALEGLAEAFESADFDDATQAQILQDSLSSFQDKFDAKALNLGAYIANLKLETASVKEVQECLSKRAKQLEKQVIYLQSYLLEQLQCMEVKKLSNAQLQILVRDNPARVVIDSEEDIPADFKTVVSEIKISKTAIGVQLKLGIPVSGCRLEKSVRLEIK
jgi:hypothetical protein